MMTFIHFDDILSAFETEVDGFDRVQHRAWAERHAFQCLREIGETLTFGHKIVAVPVTDGTVELPADMLRLDEILGEDGRRLPATISRTADCIYVGSRRCVSISYSVLPQDEAGQIAVPEDCEAAVLEWLRWRWLALRPLDDQFGELRKASVAFERNLKADAYAAIGNARGQINLKLHNKSTMMAFGLRRQTLTYKNR